MYAIGSLIRPSTAARRLWNLVLNAARVMLLRPGHLNFGSTPRRRDAPSQPRPAWADDLGEDNQLI